MEKGRIGRNDHCPCGSGRKFKLCSQSQSVPFANLPSQDVIHVGDGQRLMPQAVRAEPSQELTNRPAADLNGPR